MCLHSGGEREKGRETRREERKEEGLAVVVVRRGAHKDGGSLMRPRFLLAREGRDGFRCACMRRVALRCARIEKVAVGFTLESG